MWPTTAHFFDPVVCSVADEKAEKAEKAAREGAARVEIKDFIFDEEKIVEDSSTEDAGDAGDAGDINEPPIVSAKRRGRKKKIVQRFVEQG